MQIQGQLTYAFMNEMIAQAKVDVDAAGLTIAGTLMYQQAVMKALYTRVKFHQAMVSHGVGFSFRLPQFINMKVDITQVPGFPALKDYEVDYDLLKLGTAGGISYVLQGAVLGSAGGPTGNTHRWNVRIRGTGPGGSGFVSGGMVFGPESSFEVISGVEVHF